MTRTELGKIRKAAFGWGGYGDGMIGISFDLGGNVWGVGDHWGAWGIEHTQYCKWTEEDRLKQLGEVCMRLGALLTKAKATDIVGLIDIPVEVTFDGNKLISWRVLEEVL
jgi:hypothetical protein